MRKPSESLDDFIVHPAPEIIAEPPRPVTLRFTGEIEVLKPLTSAYVRPGSSRHLWFRRSLTVGSGFAVIALFFASAIFIGIYDEKVQLADGPTEITELAQATDREITAQPDVLTTPDTNLAGVNSDRSAEIRDPRPALRNRKSARSANRNPRSAIRSPLVESNFVPTTLIIYIDKGEIKTRIEPQLTAGYKKAPTLSN